MNTEHPARKLVNIKAALYGQPWAISEDGFRQITTIAEAHANGVLPEFAKKKMADDGDGNDTEDAADAFEDQYGFQIKNNVAIIPVSGPIFPKSNWMTQFSGATSLDTLWQMLQDAQGMDLSAIIPVFSSPGGSVQGLTGFTSDFGMMVKASKIPIIGLVNDLCASAAYMIASQCDSLLSVDGGIIGSIGVIGQVDDSDRYMRNIGVDSTVYTSSQNGTPQRKAAMPHPKDAGSYHHDAIQQSIDMYFDKFKEAVKRGRPQVDLDKVATGQVWMANAVSGDSAESMGLIDGISTLDELIAQFGT